MAWLEIRPDLRIVLTPNTSAYSVAPHLDAAVAQGLFNAAEGDDVLVSLSLSNDSRAVLGVDRPLRIEALAGGHRVYLEWHRSREFKR